MIFFFLGNVFFNALASCSYLGRKPCTIMPRKRYHETEHCAFTGVKKKKKKKKSVLRNWNISCNTITVSLRLRVCRQISMAASQVSLNWKEQTRC